jgi:hypothetical protein
MGKSPIIIDSDDDTHHIMGVTSKDLEDMYYIILYTLMFIPTGILCSYIYYKLIM